MKELEIKNSKLKALVDDEDFERLSKFNWFVAGSSIGRNNDSHRGRHKNKRISLASEIMNKPNLMFDHKDRDGFNNRKSNLRVCNYTQNNVNRAKRKGTSSIYKGVSLNKKSNRWDVFIRISGKSTRVGETYTEECAGKVYDFYAKKQFGEFAY